jgi:hypothetical protein
MRCNKRKRANIEIGNGEGMMMQAKFMMGLIAQKEDDAEREEQQMQFLALSKGVEATQKLLDSKILIAEKTLSPAGTPIWGKISELLKR